jgi:hypothetical protein
VTDVLEDVGTMTATWIDPTGVEWPLSDNGDDVGWFTTPGPAGWTATTYEIVTDPLPRGGEQVRFVRSKPGRLIWPLYVFGDTHLQWVQRHRQVRRAFTMTLHRSTPGVMRIARPDSGGAREIDAYYESGFEGEAGQGHLWSKEAITLFCPDGYWRDTAPVTTTHSYVAGDDYLDPFPTVSASLSLGEATLNNAGDVDAWPEWTITGPATAVTVTNVTTGYEWTLTWPLAAGEQIVVTTLRPTVRGPVGQNLVSALNWPTAYLWSLTPGDNAVILNVSGGGEGTSVALTFYPRYEGA